MEPDTLSEVDILTRLLSAFWREEFRGEGALEPQDTLRALKISGGFPAIYAGDEDEFADPLEFLANLPPDGYEVNALDCYDEVAWSILESVELPKDIFAMWCDQKGYLRPTFWFGEVWKHQSTGVAKSECRRWLKDRVKEGKNCSKAEYRRQAIKQIPNLSVRSFDNIWGDEMPKSWKQSGVMPKQQYNPNSD